MAAKAHVWSPWRSAHAEPGRVAVATDTGASITYATLVEHADRIGGSLRSLGIADGACLSTDLQAGPAFFAVALAALKYGFALFPVNGYLDISTASALCRAAGAVAHISAEPTSATRVSVDGEVLLYDRLVAEGRDDEAAAEREGHLWFATSGTTTGTYDVVPSPRPHHAYRGIGVFPHYAAGREFGPHIMTNPTFHLGTVGPALYALQAGSGVVVSRNWSPEQMDELIHEHGAASAFMSVDLLTEYASQGCSGNRLSKVFHGGSACPPWVKREVIKLHGPVLHEYYGTSAAGVVSEISSEEWLRRPGSVGRPLAGLDVSVERDGLRAPAGVTGEITVLRRPAGGRGRASLRTGDWGYLDEDGYLYVLGRMTDTGDSVEAVVEHGVRAMPGVQDVVAFNNSRGVTCVIEVVDGGSATWLPRVGAVVENAGARLDDVVMFAHGTLERTATGKISRVAAKRLVEARAAQACGGERNG